MNSPFLELSLGNPLTLIICLGLQTILGLHTHVILVFLILNILKAFFFETIPAPFANLPSLELSLSDHLAPIICFGLKPFMVCKLMPSLGVVKLGIVRVPSMLFHRKIVSMNLKISYYLFLYIYSNIFIISAALILVTIIEGRYFLALT
jgi:hypothetical protein